MESETGQKIENSLSIWHIALHAEQQKYMLKYVAAALEEKSVDRWSVFAAQFLQANAIEWIQ